MTVGYLYCIGNPRTDWLFRTEKDSGLNGRELRYPRGKVLGGCSSINGMIYMRGQSRDYDHWADVTGDSAWTWDNVLPYFKMHEDHYNGASAKHGAKGVNPEFFTSNNTSQDDKALAAYKQALQAAGAGGEWRVEKQRVSWEILDAFSHAAQQAGIPATTDFNGGCNDGVGYFDVNQKEGWRWNTSKAFLHSECLSRPNFHLWTSSQVSGLNLVQDHDGQQRCAGVSVWNGKQMIEATARHEVVLSSGSLGTPQLLQLSGIGPDELLRKHGISPRITLPGVGENLQDHLQVRAVFRVEGVSTLNTLANSLWGKARMGLEYLLFRTGPMSMSPSQLGAFTRSDPSQPWPNLQYHVQPLSLDAFGEPLHDFPALTASVCNLNPTSRGSVRITSADFRVPPCIAPNYLSTPEDRLVAAQSIRVTRRIASQPALAPYHTQEFRPGVQYQSDEDLARIAGDIATTIFHPVGTARMGRPSDPMAVVDSKLRVFDGRGGVIQGLRVADASIMPKIPSGNTNAPTLMIAERAAALIQSAHHNGT